MKKKLLAFAIAIALGTFYFLLPQSKQTNKPVTVSKLKKKKKTLEEKAFFVEERALHEFKMQVNPLTGEIPFEEKQLEYQNAVNAKEISLANRNQVATYTSRGPSNLGGRTRAFAIDISDNTSNTIIAGGVSSGLFRTTNGGASWSKVSPKDDIHNVTALAQDPRSGNQNIWYYGTGERSGNSASLGSAYRGRGVWKSTNNGISWTQIAGTDSAQEDYNLPFDYIQNLAVSPTTGELFIAADNSIYRYDGTNLTAELTATGSNGLTDIAITSTGIVYAAFRDGTSRSGIWTSPTGNGSWTQIAQNGTPTDWSAAGRIVLGVAPSNADIVYALYVNGSGFPNIEADLWQYNAGTTTWTDYSSTLPDEDGSTTNSEGNDPMAVQGGYDLVVSVKPDNQNFVVIGGTNAYKIADITNDAMFTRIGGYNDNSGYSLYSNGGDEHHPDIHQLVFDPNNNNVLFSGTDGGVHKTTDINAATVTWTSLNNNYQTYQYYHVALDPKSGSNIVIGGAQDNGTTLGGTDASGFGLTDNTTMTSIAGGDGVAVSIARKNGGADIEYFLGTQNGNMWRYIPSSGYTRINPTGASSQFVTYWHLDPANNDLLYYAGQGGLYRTSNSSTVNQGTWNKITGDFGQNIRTMATSWGNYSASSYLLIGGDEGKILRYDDPRDSNTSLTIAGLLGDITPTGASTAAGTIVSGLAVHPTNPDIVLATYANYGINNIYVTTNATASTPTWTLVERNLSAHSVRSAAIAEVNGKTIYFVGTARGLYSSDDPTTDDWQLQAPNQIGLAVVSQLVYRPADNKLLVGTHGNGMFEVTVTETLSTNSVVTNDLNATVYPNPVINDLNIISDKIDNDTKYVISDINGRTIKNGTVIDKKIDVRNLNAGVYLLNVESKGVQQALKFIKN